ncbi:hypothetical protein FJY63_14605, partial [Candidatus Sumerlaeota bacterium]|nr:hypothetical protein [Candidatus Sumerlaeota bacterium]
FGQVPGFRDRLVLPAPLYLLKRCAARSIMINLAFPEGSPAIENLAESGYRESLARTLADALIKFDSEHAPVADLSSTVEAKQP